MAGFTIRVGLSELGPLSVFINVEIPGGILLEPITGLTINDFSAGVEFFKTLPSIDDPFALRSSAFQLPTAQTADQWLNGLQRQVAAQAKAIAAEPGAERLHGRVHGADDDHRRREDLLDLHLAGRVQRRGDRQDLHRRQVPDRRQAQLRRRQPLDQRPPVRGPVEDRRPARRRCCSWPTCPDQVRILTIYGKLKMGFKNASGEDVVFDVLDVPATQPGSTKPTATIMNPATARRQRRPIDDRAELHRRHVHGAHGRRAGPATSIMQMVDQDHAAPARVTPFSFASTSRRCPLSSSVDGVLAYVPLRRVGNDDPARRPRSSSRCADPRLRPAGRRHATTT